MTEDEMRIELYDVVEDFYNVISSNDPIDVKECLDSFIKKLEAIRES